MTDLLRLDKQLCFALYAASRAVTQAYGPVLAALGLTYPQYLVLLVLWERDGASVKQLGERLQLDSGTLTPLLKRMESQRLVSRVRATDDERVVHVNLTAAGRALERRAIAMPKALFCKARLSVTEIGRLRGQLTTLTRSLRSDASPTKEKTRR